MKKAAVALVIVLLVAVVFLQWGLDRTPAGSDQGDGDTFPQAASLLDLLGGARQYLAYNFYIKTDKLHHAYYGTAVEEAELIPYFLLITELDPYYTSAYYIGSGVLDALGMRDRAIELNEEGLGVNPESADLYYSLGVLYLEEKRYEEAREALEKAVLYKPEIVNRNMLLTALVACYHALGDEEARRRILMEKAVYSKVKLVASDLTYEQQKGLVELINITLDEAVDTQRQ